jgi:acyl carrier protein
MDRKEVLEKIIEIAKDVFENENVVLTENSRADDFEEWDSLTHLNLISDMEDEFKIHFTLDEISDLENLGELVTAVLQHLEEK